MSYSVRLLMLLTFSCLVCTSVTGAQDMSVPVELQFKILTKVYNLDRSLKDSIEGELVVGVVYQSKLGISRKTFDALMAEARQFKDATVRGRKLRWVEIDLSQNADIEAIATSESIQVVYICPLRAQDVTEITAVSRRLDVRTCTGVPEYVAKSVSVGLDIIGEKPQIIINLRSAKEEGSEFDAQLLKLARMVE